MPDQEPPPGEYFSLVYLTPPEPQDDSLRFRERIAAYCDRKLSGTAVTDAAHDLRIDRGIDLRAGDMGYVLFGDFFKTANLHDVFDGITALFRAIQRDELAEEDAQNWREFVQIAMDGENLNYRVDKAGGVHYRVDEEFERGRAATIGILGDARYAAVAAEVGRAYERLAEKPRATNDAIWSMFKALETLTKLMVGEAKITRLGDKAVDKGLKPIVESAYAEDTSECKAASALLAGLKGWVTAGHQYRHGQERENPREAPLEFAVAMLSSGASYLRWLAEIDRQRSG